MIKNIPKKVNLGFLPTPVTPLVKFSEFLQGPEIFIKRDDMTGLGLGGNKTRKLEYILQDAIIQGSDSVITAGASQSNHCRQTAAAAALLGLECHLVLGGTAPKVANGNLLLNNIFNAKIHWTKENRKGEDIPKIAKKLKEQGKKPYIIPYGGSNQLGAYSFIDALKELEEQMDTSLISHIVFASSSGGTHAGFMLGKALLQKKYKLIGINIDKEMSNYTTFDDFIIKLANETSCKFDMNLKFTKKDLILNCDYTGKGYAVISDAEKEAIKLLAKYEGILLDPVYTAKAMAGLIGMIRKNELNRNDKVLFWHTGGTPSLFAYANFFSH